MSRRRSGRDVEKRTVRRSGGGVWTGGVLGVSEPCWGGAADVLREGRRRWLGLVGEALPPLLSPSVISLVMLWEMLREAPSYENDSVDTMSVRLFGDIEGGMFRRRRGDVQLEPRCLLRYALMQFITQILISL